MHGVLINIYTSPPDYRVLPHKKETPVSQEEPTSPSTGGPQPILLIPDSKEVSRNKLPALCNSNSVFRSHWWGWL